MMWFDSEMSQDLWSQSVYGIFSISSLHFAEPEGH